MIGHKAGITSAAKRSEIKTKIHKKHLKKRHVPHGLSTCESLLSSCIVIYSKSYYSHNSYFSKVL